MRKNRGFMLFETLVASTFILGTLIFLYIQFSNIKRSYYDSFKYNTIPGLYYGQILAKYLESDGYALYVYELSSKNEGYININSCDKSGTLCQNIIDKTNAQNVLFVSDNIETLKNDLSTGKYKNDSIFTEEFKKFILTIETIDLSGRYRLILAYKDGTFACVPIGVSSADQQRVEYKVSHWQMNLDGSNYTLKETDSFNWIKGVVVSPEVKQYSGFKSPEVQQVVIGDNTEIKYYYKRNKYKVIIADNEHLINNIETEYLYGENVNLNLEVEDGYEIKGYSGDFTTSSFTMPAKDVMITPIIEKIEESGDLDEE